MRSETFASEIGPGGSYHEDLARVEALTAWLREHVRPPPADLLYHAADAVSRLRALLEDAA